MSRFLGDRFTQGLLAGAIGWFPQACFTIPMYMLHLTKARYMDFAAVLAFNHLPKGFLDSLLAEVVVIAFQAALGGIFAIWIKSVSSENILLKGGFYGGFAWFTIYAVTALYKLEGLYPLGAGTALCSMIASVIYGVTLGWALLVINRKYEESKW